MRVCPSCGKRFPTGANFCPHDGRTLSVLQSKDVAAEEPDPLLGTVFDERYRIETRIGRGGMGLVYAARHVVIDKPVAIKVLRPEYSTKRGLVERFLREARAASRIGHPNIVDVTDFGRLSDGQVYLVMEYLTGNTLAAELGELATENKRMPLQRMLGLCVQVCQGLGAAHEKTIIHRDLKPENIFIVNPIRDASGTDKRGYRNDFVKLLDFGIARITIEHTRITRAGSVFGTPQYMSPEQAAGRDADHRGDIYAFGCILYEMITGTPPFLADTFMGTVTKQIEMAPIPPRQRPNASDIPDTLEDGVMRMLEKDPAKRIQTMAEVASLLYRCYTTPPVDTGIPFLGSPEGVSSDGGMSIQQARSRQRVTPIKLYYGVLAMLGLFAVALAIYSFATSQRLPSGNPPTRPVLQNKTIVHTVRHQPAKGVVGAEPKNLARKERRSKQRTHVSFLTYPAGAEIICDGRRLGLSPLTVDSPAGTTLRCTFRQSGHIPVTRTVFANRDDLQVRIVFSKKTGETPEKADNQLSDPIDPSPADLRNPFR